MRERWLHSSDNTRNQGTFSPAYEQTDGQQEGRTNAPGHARCIALPVVFFYPRLTSYIPPFFSSPSEYVLCKLFNNLRADFQQRPGKLEKSKHQIRLFLFVFLRLTVIGYLLIKVLSMSFCSYIVLQRNNHRLIYIKENGVKRSIKIL